MPEIYDVTDSDQLLVFICAANACRSAIAEVIATDEAQRRGVPVRVASAGTHAVAGYRAASIAQITMEEVGLSLHEHRSQPASAELISEAALVVTMTDEQRDMLQTAFKKDEDKILSFNDVTREGDVPDPIGGDPEEVRAVRERLQAAMPQIFALLERRRNSIS
jgi:protein-tyrosine-phosphatase